MGSQKALVDHLLAAGLLKQPAAKENWLKVDRAKFVPPEFKDLAYEDKPLPLGKGQTISQPSVVAFMLDLLAVKPGMKVLEVGSGSGFVTALLAEQVGPTGRVVSLEIVPSLAAEARVNLSFYNYGNINLITGDGSRGFKSEAPYDRIIISAAAEEVKEEMFNQLANQGCLVAPVGRHEHSLLVYEKIGGRVARRIYPGFIFVPLVEES